MQASYQALGGLNAKIIYHRDVYFPSLIKEAVYGNSIYVRGYTKTAENKADVYGVAKRKHFHLDYDNVIEVGLDDDGEVNHIVISAWSKGKYVYYVIDPERKVVQNLWIEEIPEKLASNYYVQKGKEVLPIIYASLTKKAAEEIIEEFDGSIRQYVYGALKHKDGSIEFLVDWEALPYMVRKAFLEVKRDKVVAYVKQGEEAIKEFEDIFEIPFEDFKNDAIFVEDLVNV